MDEFDLIECCQKNQDKLDTIKLEWSSSGLDGKILVLVEDQNDCLFFYKFFNHDVVELEALGGCDDIDWISDELNKDILCFAIRDGDFLRLCGVSPSSENVFLTDCHDVEMMCISSKRTMHALFDNFAIIYDYSIIENIFSNLRVLSFFKWFNMKNHLNYKFKNFNPSSLDKCCLTSFTLLHNIIKQRSPNCKRIINENEFREFVCSNKDVSKKELVNGHDFLFLFSKELEKRVNNEVFKERKKSVNSDSVRTVLFACFTKDCFKKSDLYKQIKKWADSHKQKSLFSK